MIFLESKRTNVCSLFISEGNYMKVRMIYFSSSYSSSYSNLGYPILSYTILYYPILSYTYLWSTNVSTKVQKPHENAEYFIPT